MSVAVAQLPAVISGKFNISLTQSNFQKLADKAATLIFNEDNLEEIKTFLAETRKVEKAIEETHKEGKAEALKIGRDWDAGKNTFLQMVADIKATAQTEYEKICTGIANRQRQQQLEKKRIYRVSADIESNAVMFAKQIADCTTLEELTGVERKINLEKTRKDKYDEFLPNAIMRFSELNTILASQKVIVKELEENALQQAKAIQEQNDAELLGLKEQQETQQARIEENKVVVQETAISQSLNQAAPVYATEVLPEVKARRTTWKYEVINEKEVIKKNPELIIFTLDVEKVKALLKTLKDTEQLDGKTEMIVNGIRFFEVKSF